MASFCNFIKKPKAWGWVIFLLPAPVIFFSAGDEISKNYEKIDNLISTAPYLWLMGICITFAGLLYTVLQQRKQAETIAESNSAGNGVNKDYAEKTKQLGEAVKFAFVGFFVSLIGVGENITFDKFLEFTPKNGITQPSIDSLVNYLSVGGWRDVVDVSAGTGLLCVSLGYLTYAARTAMLRVADNL